jgi:hypothetical protein
MSRKYKFQNPSAAYFISFATVYWIDVFTLQRYFSILKERIAHCRANKGMEVFAYCFMPKQKRCNNYNSYGKGLRLRARRSH